MAQSTRNWRSIREKVEQLKKTHDYGILCSKCVVDAPDRQKGEYYLYYSPFVEDGVYSSRHATCRRDWLLGKRRSSSIWFRVRPLQGEPGPSGLFGVCEYSIDEDECVVEKADCPSGDSCLFAHSDVECDVWNAMYQMQLDFYALKMELLVGITKREKQRLEQILEQGESANFEFGEPPPIDSISNLTIAANIDSTIPADAVRPGHRYGEETLFAGGDSKKCFNIRVTRVENPSTFYFQTLENAEDNESAWKSINDFYDSETGDRYKMDEDDLLRKLPIAAKLKSKDGSSLTWCRAEIIDFVIGPGGLIEVTDVDFGGVQYVKLEAVRFLKSEYFDFQKQATEATLAGASPLDGYRWTKEAVEMTKQFFDKYPLAATVHGIVNGKLTLTVSDAADPRHVISLTELLIKNRHASSFRAIRPMPFKKEPASKSSSRQKAFR